MKVTIEDADGKASVLEDVLIVGVSRVGPGDREFITEHFCAKNATEKRLRLAGAAILGHLIRAADKQMIFAALAARPEKADE